MNTITFITSFLTFYLKGEISQEKNFVKFKIPNTILGLIPLGAHKKTIAVNQIASTDTDFRLLFKNLLIGIVVAIIGLASFSSSALAGLVVLALGVLIVLNSFQTELVVHQTSGQSLIVSFIIFEKSKAEEASEGINNLISTRMDETNTREQTDRVVDAINNK
ncbi:MAG: hypothetical protein J6O41_06120 [Clostridia bacterium]|nr:hypothetical protein [Clostridia bacterium]